MNKYIKYNPISNPEVEGEFVTVDIEALKEAKRSMHTLICLLTEKQGNLLRSATSGYGALASLDHIKNDLAKSRELLNHITELIK